MTKDNTIPQAFIWRRLHSLTGLFLALFLIEHLLTNSQAALLIGEDGRGFVKAVNWIKNLPYLPFIEIFLLGVPILIHAAWGIKYLRTGELNSFRTDGTKPSLAKYPRNQAYSWQRITSWILLIALTGHIVHFRFMKQPAYAAVDGEKSYMVKMEFDKGMVTLAPRLGVELYDQKKIDNYQVSPMVSGTDQKDLLAQQKREGQEAFLEALTYRPIEKGQVIAVAPDFGTAELLTVREAFKSPLLIVLYTIFVLSACYHGFNGLWTFMISWGVTLTARSQVLMRRFSIFLMVLISFLGLAAIWGTYYINLRS